MSSTHTYGRNRQSLADIEREIDDLFRNHPNSTTNDEDEPVIPGDALVDILRTFSQNHNALELMTKEEEGMLIQLVESNPGLAVTPQVLLQFIAMRTTASPNPSSDGTPADESEDPNAGGLPEDRIEYEYDNRSRSSSPESIGTSVYRPQSRPPSRGPPAVPPKTPNTPMRESPFDVSRRQRTNMLANAPSSWTRRPPPQRRRSDAGFEGRAMSDSETSVSSPPISYSRSQGSNTGRARAPSNPVSPNPYPERESGSFSPISIGSPSFGTISRPHSRAQSQPQGHFNSLNGFALRHRSTSPEDDRDYYHENDPQTGLMSPPPSDRDASDLSFDDDEHLVGRISSLPMPNRRGSDSDDDSDGDDPTLGLVHERYPTSSTVSLDMSERIDALQRVNDELRRKLNDTEENLQKRLMEREAEIEDMQQRLDEMKSELISAKRHEKELRAKERSSMTQIQALEQNITQLSKSLENSRQAYQNLNFQYGEQCEESQRYREMLVARDQELQQLKDSTGLQALELRKWEDEHTHWLEQSKVLEDELASAQKTQAALDEQKQENMMLKETIDRMRFEMDEMRAATASGLNASGGASAKNTISKSLGAELLKMNDGVWDKEGSPDPRSPEPEEEDEDEESSEEDVVQTIITRTKRKVGSRAKKIETIQLDEVKEYSDAGIQHDLATRSFFVQTDPEPRPIVASSSIQTDETSCNSMSTQTDPQPTVVEMIIQTEPATEEEDEPLASSSSTVRPPTPKAQPLQQLHSHPHDLPPSYNQVAGHDQDELARRVANETLKKWHKGLKLPIEPVAGGISEDAVEDWKALKEELGIECEAIERIVEGSGRTGLPRPSKTPRRNRFYNIYNTYVYGDRSGGNAGLLSNGQFIVCIGLSAIAFVVGSSMATPHYAVPGGPTYYDRAAWASFNSMRAVGEGFPGDGSTAFWGFLGRLGGNAARTLQGWPT